MNRSIHENEPNEENKTEEKEESREERSRFYEIVLIRIQ